MKETRQLKTEKKIKMNKKCHLLQNNQSAIRLCCIHMTFYVSRNGLESRNYYRYAVE